jgi:hypothetical protein
MYVLTFAFILSFTYSNFEVTFYLTIKRRKNDSVDESKH